MSSRLSLCKGVGREQQLRTNLAYSPSLVYIHTTFYAPITILVHRLTIFSTESMTSIMSISIINLKQ